MAGAAKNVINKLLGYFKKGYRNYNVLERTENLMDVEKRPTSPRHPGTEQKFDVLIKENREIREEMEKKPIDLLKRLNTVKVNAAEVLQDGHSKNRELPLDRENHPIPKFGYEEPKVIPEGKCSLRQALEFISNNQNDPNKWTFQAIADNYRLKYSDVEQVVKNFRAFEMYCKHDEKVAVAKSSLNVLGANKIVQPKFSPRYAQFEIENKPEKEEK